MYQIGDHRLQEKNNVMAENDLKTKIEKIDFAVEKSMRYHQRRRGFYESFHNALMFLTIISGSAAFADMSNYFGGMAAIFTAVNLVWGLSHRARDHEILFRRFSELAISIRTMPEETKEAYDKLMEKRIEIETEEPPIYWALEADCDNEVRRAWDRTKKMVPIDWWCRTTMNWLHHAKRSFDPAP